MGTSRWVTKEWWTHDWRGSKKEPELPSTISFVHYLWRTKRLPHSHSSGKTPRTEWKKEYCVRTNCCCFLCGRNIFHFYFDWSTVRLFCIWKSSIFLPSVRGPLIDSTTLGILYNRINICSDYFFCFDTPITFVVFNTRTRGTQRTHTHTNTFPTTKSISLHNTQRFPKRTLRHSVWLCYWFLARQFLSSFAFFGVFDREERSERSECITRR